MLRGRVLAGRWRLESVINRLHGTVGQPALELISALSVDTPNVSHLFLALHLLNGGTQFTLNFDNGVERAVSLLVGDEPLPIGAPKAVADALRDWQQLVPRPVVRPLVVANQTDFSSWRQSRQHARGILFKLHGSIAWSGSRWVADAPVVTDEQLLNELDADRVAALDRLKTFSHVLVSGYAGDDPDVFQPLLDRCQGCALTWADPFLRPEIRVAVQAAGGQPLTGAPAKADVVLRNEISPGAPGWPTTWTTSSSWQQRVDQKLANIDAEDAAEAFAWMLADNREPQVAIEILRAVPQRANARTTLRIADALYLSGTPGAKRAARSLFLRLALRARRDDPVLYSYSIGRAAATLRSSRLPLRLVGMLGPWIALCTLRGAGPGYDTARGVACAQNAHNQLRLCESIAPSVLSRKNASGIMRWMVRTALSNLDAADRHFQRAGDKRGDPLAFRKQQRIELTALGQLAGLAGLSSSALAELDALQTHYCQVTNEIGVANTEAAKALVHAARRNLSDAQNCLARAENNYAGDVSGVRLVSQRKKILAALSKTLARP